MINDKKKEQNKKWYLANKEQIQEYKKSYRTQNKEKIKEQQKRWVERNLVKHKEHNRLYYEQNKEEMKQKAREYRKTDAYRISRKNTLEKISTQFKTYQSGSRVRGLEFLLSIEDFIKITSEPCFYCWIKSKWIDRVDNSLWYTIENSISCCTMCNMMKKAYSQELFLQKINEIYLNNQKRIWTEVN